MTAALLVAKRDLASYLYGMTGWIIVAAVLFVDGVLFALGAMGGGAQYSHEVLEKFFYYSSGPTMIATVFLTMRTFAEERQTGTDTLLRTSPVSEAQLVFGKYLAVMGVLAILTLLTAYMPLLIFVNGKVSVAHILVGYAGLMVLGSGTAAIGIFGSSLFRNQMAAGIVSGVIVGVMLLLWLLSDLTDPPFTSFLANLALYDKHFTPFQEGRLLTSGLVYYAAVSFGFLLLATRVIEGRRWR